MKPVVVTIGVYGFTSERFLEQLLASHVEVFCDLRSRRGMRGSAYAFANSKYLQQMLQAHGIRYLHIKALAPAIDLREIQKQADEQQRAQKRTRAQLAPAFIETYKQANLANFNAHSFLQLLGEETRVLALFCVEREPAACHRSLVAARLVQDFDLSVIHIFP